MRKMLRYLMALCFLGFLCKIAVQARAEDAPLAAMEGRGIPKSLLLASLKPQEPIPSHQIDARRILKVLEAN